MPGVRIHHPTLRHAMLAIPTTREYGKPLHCRRCDEPHTVKHYHVIIDSDGNAIVSEVVWARLREIGTHDFIVLNEVAKPPTQRVGMDSRRQRDDRRMVKQVGEALEDMAPRGTTVTITTER